MKKSSNSKPELKKSVAYKKERVRNKKTILRKLVVSKNIVCFYIPLVNCFGQILECKESILLSKFDWQQPYFYSQVLALSLSVEIVISPFQWCVGHKMLYQQ